MASTATVAPIVAAITTAGVALVVSVVTLWVSGHRERRQWRRDATCDALAELLDGSFGVGSRNALAARRGSADLESYVERARNKLAAQNRARSRLRLVADKAVVQAADRLHEADLAIGSAVLLRSTPPTDQEYDELRAAVKSARRELIRISRRSIGLRGDVVLEAEDTGGHGFPPF
jgi:hypothetical protein